MVEAVQSGPHFEAMGWDGLWLSDHLLGIAEDHLHQQAWLDVMVSMAHLAAQTTRIRIGSGVLVLPYRNPVLTARMVASLDRLSGGRIDLGVGVGWLIREYQALGVGDVFDDRGSYANEVLDVILECWKGGTVQFKGTWFDVPPVVFEAPPVQLGGRVPLWVGSLSTTGAPIARRGEVCRLLASQRGRHGGSPFDTRTVPGDWRAAGRTGWTEHPAHHPPAVQRRSSREGRPLASLRRSRLRASCVFIPDRVPDLRGLRPSCHTIL